MSRGTGEAAGSTVFRLRTLEPGLGCPARTGIDQAPCLCGRRIRSDPRQRGDLPSARGSLRHKPETTPHARGSTRRIRLLEEDRRVRPRERGDGTVHSPKSAKWPIWHPRRGSTQHLAEAGINHHAPASGIAETSGPRARGSTEAQRRGRTPDRVPGPSGGQPRPRGSPRLVDALLSIDSSQSTIAGLLSVAAEERGHDIGHRHAVGSEFAQNSGVRPANPDGGVVRVRRSAPLGGEHPPHGALAHRRHPRDFPHLCRRRHGPRVYLAPCITRHGARPRTGRLDCDRPASAGIDPTTRPHPRRGEHDAPNSAGAPSPPRHRTPDHPRGRRDRP